jgi:CTP-dependent riboflavin kinase
MPSTISREIIEEKILENLMEYQDVFIEFQSYFCVGLYKRYQNIENGNLVLYFAKQVHQDILRQKDYDLNFNCSFKKFWENHKLFNPIKNSLIKIANEICLPKETTRRKIAQLIKKKVLSKKNNYIGWLPNEQYKENYNLFISEEIENLSRIFIFVTKKINLSITSETITEELKKKFNFYWFHYLSTQLKYLKLWSVQIKDLELFFILLQVVNIFSSKTKKDNLLRKQVYNNPSAIKNFSDASISATSISEVTGISRATCIRKLENLVKLKFILKDKISKRYYLSSLSFSENLISKKITQEATKIFNDFYFICIRAMFVKNSS